MPEIQSDQLVGMFILVNLCIGSFFGFISFLFKRPDVDYFEIRFAFSKPLKFYTKRGYKIYKFGSFFFHCGAYSLIFWIAADFFWGTDG